MIVRIIASVAIATGLFVAVPEWRSYVSFPRHMEMYLSMVGPLLTAAGLIIMIIPVIKIITGIWLFIGKRWAWLSAIVVLTLDLLIGLQSAVRMFILSFNHPAQEIPQDPSMMVTTVSLWPTYIISIIAIISVLILVQKPIRRQFDRQRELA